MNSLRISSLSRLALEAMRRWGSHLFWRFPMNAIVHLGASVDALLAAFTTAWAALGEIITAGALLLVLDRIAASIRTTYAAGVFMGRLLWPAIHWVAGVLRLIDWRLVGAVVLDGSKALLALSWVTAVMTRQLLFAWSEQLAVIYASWIAPPAPVAPATVHPLAELAIELEAMTCKQLRELTGCKRKLRKAELVAMALAY
jgi:hypothetical protein